jgi:hypothetical protein
MDMNKSIEDFIEKAQESSNGIQAISVVEISSGMTLGSYTDGSIDPEVASAYNVEVVKAKLKAIKALGMKENIDDILITLSSQYHLLNCTKQGTHLIYLAADKSKANLAILRRLVSSGVEQIEAGL